MNDQTTYYLISLLTLIPPQRRVAAITVLRDLLNLLLADQLPAPLKAAIDAALQPPNKRLSPGRPPHPNLAVTVVNDPLYQVPCATYVGRRAVVDQYLRTLKLPRLKFTGRTEERRGFKGVAVVIKRAPAGAPGNPLADLISLLENRPIY